MDKNLNISRWLMLVSVLVIIAFQAYWLRKVYVDTYHSLQREISVVMRETFIKDQFRFFFNDSLSSRIERDTSGMNSGRVQVVTINDSQNRRAGWQQRDSQRIFMRVGEKRDSGRNPNSATRVMAIEAGTDNSQIGKTLIVTIPVSAQVIEKGKMDSQFYRALEKAGLPSTFTIDTAKVQPMGGIRMRGPGEPGRTNQKQGFHMVLADLDFGNPFYLILGKMYGQILVAIFMTGMVILAFRFMYRSLKTQLKTAILKNDFISNMTHELKTPVATVSVAIEALKNFSAIENPERTREYLDISSAELNRLSMLIDKVLRINMFEADKLEMENRQIDLSTLTTEVVQAQQLQADKLQAIIRWNPTPEPVWVRGDKLHLMSVLYNLLDNALKYRSEHPEIEVELTAGADKVYWKVKDNGPGIAAEYRSRVFEKFFRVPQGDRHDIKGYGLGLSYVHEVISKHGGTIKVESEKGKGCIFTVALPAEKNS